MNLKVRIHDKEYEIAQGATFSEEYNETLDSGAIRIPHISQIENLRPYDDVYIYESGYDFNEFIKTPVYKMSGGMKKRLSIGCAMPFVAIWSKRAYFSSNCMKSVSGMTRTSR